MKEPHGWLTPEVAHAMEELILATQPDVVVEIGVFAGLSLIHTAKALRANGHGVVYGIDPWRKEDAIKGLGTMEDPSFWDRIDLDAVHYDCMRAIWDRGLEDYVIIVRATSQVAAQLFTFQRRDEIDVIDILYIDGGHSEGTSCLDVELYLPCVKSGGHIWFDDADWASTQKAVDMLKSQCNWKKDLGHCHLYQKP